MNYRDNYVVFFLVPGFVYITLTVVIMSRAGSDLPVRQIRSPLMRAVYNKIVEDERQKNDTHEYWYTVDLSQLSEDVRAKFLQTHQDKGTTKFLDNCYEKSDWFFTQLGHSFCKSILGWFMSSTSINGLLKRGSMFVFSDEQLQQLLDIEPAWKGDRLLDLGAGDGRVTEIMAKYYRQIDATEVSSTMVWRLQEKGFNVVPLESWDSGDVTYDLIGCLNLLDRCDKPMKILHSIKKILRPGVGKAIVSVVLPFEPYVEQDSTDHQPTERLLIKGQTFEAQATSFITEVFEPLGFTVEHFTRLPYLCEGDMHKSFYVLNDVVFVLSVKDKG